MVNLRCKNSDIWPSFNKKLLEDISINLVVQINGKTRDVIKIKRNASEKDVDKLASSSQKAKKYIKDKNIIKTIFVKNKIINYIIKE